MSAFTSLMEICATVIELFLVFSMLAEIFGTSEKHSFREYYLPVVACTVVLALFVSFLNYLEIFSFLTVFLSILLTILFGQLLYRKPFLVTSLATVLIYLTIHSIDYIVLFLLGAAFERPIHDRYSFSLILAPGKTRILFLTVDKGMDVLLFFLAKKQMKRLLHLKKSAQLFLLATSCIVYVIMAVMLSLIISDSMLAMQAAVIVAWVFMLLCIVSLVVVLQIYSSHQEEKAANRLLITVNTMMEDNYARLHRLQTESSKRNHDINNHLKVLRSLVEKNETERAATYIDDLLAVSNEKASLCHSGNDVIDAILNTKITEAQEQKIRFEFQANFSLPTDIAPVDLCAVLANQIDNAFDACKRIEEPSKRYIRVHIWQKDGSLAIFQVNNTVNHNPFEGNENLLSTKSDDSMPHGLGIKNIRDTAAKYNGMLENAYQDGEFISIAFLNFQLPAQYSQTGGK